MQLACVLMASVMLYALQANKLTHDVLPCYCIPLGTADRFFDREEALRKIGEALQPGGETSGIRSIALHGMGEV
jgi:hypothetical protein